MFIERIVEGTPTGLRGWPALVGAMVAEVRSGATEDQARGFFNTVGERLARMAPMDDVEDADVLRDRINALWSTIDFGRVAFRFDDQGIDIHHEGLPHVLGTEDDGLWTAVLGQILEGAYGAWFRSLGSGSHLHTRVTGWTDQGVDLRHGL
jgi:hypothetical protein